MPRRIDEARLFAATVACYAEAGYAGTTTKDIAERAGVNEVTLFRRYGSKAELIVAALRDRLGGSPFGRLAPSGDLEADVSSITRAYAATVETYGGVVLTLLHDLSRYDELAEARGPLSRNLAAASAILEGHQNAGRLVSGDPRQVLVRLLAPVAMAGLWAQVAGAAEGGLDVAAHVRAFLQGHAR